MEFSGYKLKTKAYFIECIKQHAESHEEFKTNIALPNVEMQTLLNQIGIEISAETDFKNICKELLSGSFDGYASLLFFIEFECICNAEEQLATFYEAINENPQLKYVTKIVTTDTHFKLEFTETHVLMSCMDGGKRQGFNLHSDAVLLEKLHSPEEIAFGHIAKKVFSRNLDARSHFVQDMSRFLEMKTPNVDNLTVLQSSQMGLCQNCGNKFRFGEFLQYMVELAQTSPVQELALKCIIDVIRNDSHSCTKNPISYINHILINGVLNYFSTTSTAGCYVFNINPALAIFINHLSFTGFTIRAESVHDINNLKETFMRKKIPHIVLKDGSAEEVKRLMLKVQTTRLSGLKYLYIFIMSHGDEGDIIHTKTDSYNINENIIGPLRANASLQHVQKFVLVNACRGSFDPRYDDDDLELQQAEEIEDDERLVKIFSTQKGCISLLEPGGSIFVQKFCDIFKSPFNELYLEKIVAEIERQLLREWLCFERLTEYCTMPGVLHNIKMEFEKLRQHEELFQEFHEFVEFYNFDHTLPLM